MLGIKKLGTPKSVIGSDMRVTGRCSFQGNLQVDGTIVGDVVANEGQPSTLEVSEGARIEGAVSADRISMGGVIVGPVQAREHLELLATARIEGQVRYKTLEMQPGAVVAGQLRPQVTPPAGAAPSPPAPTLPTAPTTPDDPTTEPGR